MENSRNINRFPSGELSGRVILLNAPMGTGKDYLADRIQLALDCQKLQFKDSIFNICKAMTGLTDIEFLSIYSDRTKKETPQPEFYGMSPREFMIWISEDVCKPRFGKEFFGTVSAKNVDAESGVVFSDSGFPDEVVPLCERFGADNVYVVRFTRNGAKFKSNDSRDYLDPQDCPEGVKFLPFMENDGCIQEFVNQITWWVLTH